ncbi:MAG: hypothetical protein ACR2FO_05105 [Actinomycetota bacterium]
MAKNRISIEHLSRIVVSLVVGLLTILIAGPAVAVESGVGVVTVGTWFDEGTSTDQPPPPLGSEPCGGTVTQTTATWAQTGSYTASSGTSSNGYVGPTQVTMTSNDQYWFDPIGSYSQDMCAAAPQAPGQPVAAALTVKSIASNSVSCALTGVFSRTAVTTIMVTSTGTCTVSGLPANVTHLWTFELVANPLQPNTITGGIYSET